MSATDAAQAADDSDAVTVTQWIPSSNVVQQKERVRTTAMAAQGGDDSDVTTVYVDATPSKLTFSRCLILSNVDQSGPQNMVYENANGALQVNTRHRRRRANNFRA